MRTRHMGERAIRRRLAFSDAIIQSIGEGVCALDRDGRFTFVNPVAARLLGWTEADLLGRQLDEILPRADANDAPSNLHDAISSGTVANFEAVFRRHDGSLLVVSVNAAPIVMSSEVRGAVVVFRDLTAERDAEQQLRAARTQAQRLAALEQTKSEFLKLASHELRGPIAVLGGYLSMIEDGSVADSAEVLDILHGKVAEMEQLVEKMLEAARLEDGNIRLQLEPIDLREAVGNSIRSARLLAPPEHRIELHDAKGVVPVLADSARLRLTIDNLLENAIKFSPAGGRVDCSVVSDGRWASVSIRDRGFGIAPEDMAHLFTRFGRPAKHDTASIPGTGLGLYLARELARLHGGDVKVDSRVGKGTTFTLLLPVHADHVPRAETLLSRVAGRRSEKPRPALASRTRVASR